MAAQDDLFGLTEPEDNPPPRPGKTEPPASGDGSLQPADVGDELIGVAQGLAARYGDLLRMGTSSWNFPGWHGLVWGREYAESTLSRRGLTAYSRHPLLRTVSLDRSFYRPMAAAEYAALAAQVGPGFRFVVKAPAMVTDATVREAGSGKAMEPNPLFLDPPSALDSCLRPAVQGLGATLGVLVFQLSPLPPRWLNRPAELLERLDALWSALLPELPEQALLALEVRDAQLLTPELARLLKRHGVRYCLGLHDRMPTVAEQLPMLRAMWPGALVCRWNLQRGFRYQQAKDLFEPFDKLAAPDPANRAELARVIAATAAAGHPVFVTVNNKAEGSAPLSIFELARQLVV
jgi:uncharacterized protein YecE (DUF72 family)